MSRCTWSGYADWLRVHGVTDVAMEATRDYWKAPFFRLEAEGFDRVLADAKQVKHLPGRPKSDQADCVWLAKNFERGMLAACFVATEEFRTIRLHTRYRRNLTQERTREKQRVEKLLEDTLIKLSCALTDVHGVSGRAIMEALIAGQKDPRTLAELTLRQALPRAQLTFCFRASSAGIFSAGPGLISWRSGFFGR
ncbi:transposase [Nonomuraea purpurea]|uniref:Transposase n=1 Tax=Nonomuraea purpurea TaxID=1849276 RepID=A0ABV8GSV5_9ACTN